VENIRAGRLRALGVTTAARAPELPDVPAISEFLPGYETSAWFGLGASRNISSEVIDRLNKEINAGLADPKLRSQLIDLGATVLFGWWSECGTRTADDTDKGGKLIRAAGIKPE